MDRTHTHTTRLIVEPLSRSERIGPESNGPMSGAILGFESDLARTNCRKRLEKLGYWTMIFVDTQAEYALSVGGWF